jgi:hypothetical protein
VGAASAVKAINNSARVWRKKVRFILFPFALVQATKRLPVEFGKHGADYPPPPHCS